MSQVAYWRLSSFYLFFFASIGTLVPYWSLYLNSLGFDAAEIGELMAVMMATKIIAPNIWGWIADRSGHRMWVVRLGAVMALLMFAGVFWGQGYWWLVAVIGLFSFFWHAVLPQFEATTMSQLGEHVHQYGRIRLWGSVGFILTAVGVGYLLDGVGPQIVPWMVALMLLGVCVVSFVMPRDVPQVVYAQQVPIWQVLGQREVLIVLLVCFLLQASHGPYYTFYSIYLQDHGYSTGMIGLLWALGVLAEIGVFLVMHRLLPRFGVRALLLLSLALTTVRWVLIGVGAEWMSVVVFAQLLHAASFGIYHAVAIHMVHKLFTGRHQGRGQALYSSISFGVGGAVGALASGYLWSSVGASWTFVLAALLSGMAFLLAWRGVRAAYV